MALLSFHYMHFKLLYVDSQGMSATTMGNSYVAN